MSGLGRLVQVLTARFRDAEAEIEQLKLRLDNTIREGRVTKVLPDKGKVEVDMNGLASDELDLSHRSGSQREWDPPSVGERVLVLSPTGEPGLGVVLPGGYSDDFPAPHDKAGEYVRSNGETRLLQTADRIEISAPTIVLRSGSATVTLTADLLKALVERVENNGRNIGADHTHGGVLPGGSNTDIPNA
jgi:phage baseplate assembly protein V